MLRGKLLWAVGGLLAGTLAAGLGFAQQQVISAQSGTVQYVEGTVYADGQQVARKFGQFPSLRQGDELRTEDGRAEVLLTPGAFLRLAEHSSVRMVSNRLSDTRVEVLSGTVMAECDELLKDNAVALVFKGSNIQLEKHGLYRLDSGQAEFRVYDGEALIQSSSGQMKVRAGKEATLGAVLTAQHFNQKLDKDDFYEWSSQRSGNLAYASVTASQSVLNTGTPWNAGGWMWSGLLDEWTYLPGAGLLYSPFGYGFWSPFAMGYYYTPVYYTSGGTGVGGTSAGFGTGKSGRTGGAATNPRPSRPVPSLIVAASAPRSGTSYGGVAAALAQPSARSFGGGGFRGGYAANSGGGFSGASSAVSSSGGAFRSGGGSGFSGGGFSGGGFSGGGHSGGGGGHR